MSLQVDLVTVPGLDAVVDVLVGPDWVRAGPYRVDDRRRDVIVLDPLPDVVDLPDLDDPRPGDLLRLRWLAGDSLILAEAHVVRVAAGGVWWLKLVGRVDVPRRRAGARRTFDGAVLVSRGGGGREPGETFAGRVLDIAIGGLRCHLGVGAAGLAAGEQVTVRLDLDRRRYVVAGRVVRSSWPRRVAGRPAVELAVAFDDLLAPAQAPTVYRPRGWVPPPR